ncbi:hypothetical protein [Alistipes putredinis]|uniref:hypothetical protein n=1 Tax=Alistipes putredinis TaxID=28117 RepID=UPI00205A9C75|nr:MAG TPA: hypothetical protein [Crassvirales sp.]
MIKKKISELPECTSFKGLWTIGVDIFNKSVKVPLEYIQSVVEGMKSATKNATDATSAANSAAQTADNAAQRAQAATTAANTATTNANNATAAAIEAKEDCEEVIAAAAELEPLNLVPTAMTVEYPSRLLVGNMAENFIRATLAPASVKPNVLFLGDDKAVSVTPDGRITILAAGISIIHVIPTCNVALYKTIQIKVSEPTVRLVTLSSIRLTANGNFRFN